MDPDPRTQMKPDPHHCFKAYLENNTLKKCQKKVYLKQRSSNIITKKYGSTPFEISKNKSIFISNTCFMK